jgi:hypothetical protein
MYVVNKLVLMFGCTCIFSYVPLDVLACIVWHGGGCLVCCVEQFYDTQILSL